LADRRIDLLLKEVAALRAFVSRARALYPFTIDAWFVLPEHLHAVWMVPEPNEMDPHQARFLSENYKG
jgi:putative transposase